MKAAACLQHYKKTTMKRELKIGITYGDPAGIGPEILRKVLRTWKYDFTPCIIGEKGYLNFKPGYPSKLTGKHSYKCLRESAKLGISKKIKALITGPVSKEMINKTNRGFNGQTDELAKLCKVNPNEVIMLFSANDLRLALFTRHIPLKEVSLKITKKTLYNFLIKLNKELKKWFKIKNPKIAVLGLNPHAGENGLFGKEEKNIITPVIKKLNKSGLKIFGPLSPDGTLAKAGQGFLLKKKQKYDVYVSFYHDQGLPMFKAVAGLNGVNITLGLPFLRVSVDHGTAFDIAGKNIASPQGLISAIKFVEVSFIPHYQ